MKVSFSGNKKTVGKSFGISDERIEEIKLSGEKIFRDLPLTQGDILEKFFNEVSFKDKQELAFATYFITSMIKDYEKRETFAKLLESLI